MPSHPARNPAEGGADISVPAAGEVNRAQSSNIYAFRVVQAYQQRVGARLGRQWRGGFLHIVRIEKGPRTNAALSIANVSVI